jgi:hypothetical protein
MAVALPAASLGDGSGVARRDRGRAGLADVRGVQVAGLDDAGLVVVQRLRQRRPIAGPIRSSCGLTPDTGREVARSILQRHLLGELAACLQGEGGWLFDPASRVSVEASTSRKLWMSAPLRSPSWKTHPPAPPEEPWVTLATLLVPVRLM